MQVLPAPARLLADALASMGFARIAVVQSETGSWDQAFHSPKGEPVLVRYAPKVTTEDRTHLEEISSQRSFTHVIYVAEDALACRVAGIVATNPKEFEAVVTTLL